MSHTMSLMQHPPLLGCVASLLTFFVFVVCFVLCDVMCSAYAPVPDWCGAFASDMQL